ncbi:hypothetical protein SAY87_014234 [Trapa incisa]|uniref:Uncharacterized protein n=1 Tax=Trapa incisa TaxID=236973 RepID=A0AAN7GVA5_9MYRT|nr:hypothetical protein SAY87_014234 [Trapa incisa]
MHHSDNMVVEVGAPDPDVTRFPLRLLNAGGTSELGRGGSFCGDGRPDMSLMVAAVVRMKNRWLSALLYNGRR